jgi:omega-6 fatty acid desaturase (delta-12 desaturase)
MTAPTPAPARRAPDARERALLAATRPFARPEWRRGAWQVADTAVALAVCFGLLVADGPGWVRWVVAPVLGLVFVRVFLLQHDAGHHSLLPGRLPNQVVGHAASVLIGIPFEPFRTEHAWHHKIQGRLDLRDFDHFDPVTDDEARRDPSARWRGHPLHVLALNLDSLLLRRKLRGAYYMYRRGGDLPPNHAAITASLWFNAVSHAALHAAVALAGGPSAWLALLAALGTSLVVGTGLMWVQHNFERVLHFEDPAEWSFVRVALEGTSWLALPGPLRWFTADAGVHHVHHLNPAIPNYRLEEARRAIPEVAAVPPLSARDVARSFTHAIWSRSQRRMVPYRDVVPEETSS